MGVCSEWAVGGGHCGGERMVAVVAKMDRGGCVESGAVHMGWVAVQRWL